ncbi:hypothetical protein GCM10010372_30590 [Streptomyces tauricus]|uniref:hypothetical protein n=1 Tax=Streptomyces tauricus TaxID=68274 RepID=UPI001671AB81|nr:hypothetical protein [Streptomyces tauricus]GHA28678.1 hypothetical protein GCM10010372_30590 [Streptomyces tauricus]
MAVSGALLAISASGEASSSIDLGTARAPQILARRMSLGSGSGAGNADRLFSDRRTLAASASEDLDLAGTALIDAFGAQVTFARVKGLVIAAAAGNTNNLLVGASSGNQWATLLNSTGVVTLRPGAFLAVGTGDADPTGYAVTASTGDLLKIANSAAGTSVTYDIHIIGASA